jgi:parvulin-like peptidyl-prolyl isomerase
MKRLHIFLPFVNACCVGLMTLAGGVVGWAQSAEAPKEYVKPKDRPVAMVNGAPILASELKETMAAQEQILRYQLHNDPAKLEKALSELKAKVTNTLIDCQILVDEFYKIDGVIKPEYVDKDLEEIIKKEFKGNRDAFMAELAKNGMTLERFRGLRERMVIMHVMRARFAGEIELTDENVREHYEKNKQRWMKPERVKFHTISVSKKDANARSLMESLHKKLVSGGDFAEIARANSMDSHGAAGGAWKWMDLARLSQSVSDALAKLKPGEIRAVTEQPENFIILRLDERRGPEPKIFESVKDEVKKSLYQEVFDERVEKKMIRLREAADIQRMEAV